MKSCWQRPPCAHSAAFTLCHPLDCSPPGCKKKRPSFEICICQLLVILPCLLYLFLHNWQIASSLSLSVSISPIHTRVCILRHFSCVNSVQAYGLNLPGSSCPWGSPGKNTGVGCHAVQGIFPNRDWTCISWGSGLAGRFYTTEHWRSPCMHTHTHFIFLNHLELCYRHDNLSLKNPYVCLKMKVFFQITTTPVSSCLRKLTFIQ